MALAGRIDANITCDVCTLVEGTIGNISHNEEKVLTIVPVSLPKTKIKFQELDLVPESYITNFNSLFSALKDLLTLQTVNYTKMYTILESNTRNVMKALEDKRKTIASKLLSHAPETNERMEIAYSYSLKNMDDNIELGMKAILKLYNYTLSSIFKKQQLIEKHSLMAQISMRVAEERMRQLQISENLVNLTKVYNLRLENVYNWIQQHLEANDDEQEKKFATVPKQWPANWLNATFHHSDVRKMF